MSSCSGACRAGGGFRQQGAGPAVEPGDFQQHPQVAAAQQGGRPGNDAAPLGPCAGVFQAAAVAADGHAHFGVLGFDAELGEQAQERGVRPLVVDDEAGVHAQGGPVPLRHIVGVGVAAEPGVRLEERYPVLPVQHVRGGQPRHSAADDGDPPACRNPCCLRHWSAPVALARSLLWAIRCRRAAG